jgi:hypothetical protein
MQLLRSRIIGAISVVAFLLSIAISGRPELHDGPWLPPSPWDNVK